MRKEIGFKDYSLLLKNIGSLLEEGRRRAAYSVNSILIQTYWRIGQSIVEYEQQGNIKAVYGSKTLDNLSKDLKAKYGRGFGRRNVLDMRRLYLRYPNRQTLSAKLSWSHYVELLTVESDLERGFYEKECLNEEIKELMHQSSYPSFCYL